MDTALPYREILNTHAQKQGLLHLGVVSLQTEQDYSRFARWLEEKKHAGMRYLENHRDLRKNPSLLLPNAKVAIVVALPYYGGETGEFPKVAQYARFRDYHRILKERGRALFQRVLRDVKTTEEFRVAVDSAPILEKALATKTELGFMGKNTLYIHPLYGSFLLLAEILTTLELPIDDKIFVSPEKRSEVGGCGSCKSCQVACPTGALQTDYSIDANRCLAYWTIEHRGLIPEEFWPWLSEYWFGCDVCQTVCPYNQRTENQTLPSSIQPISMPSLYTVATMSQPEYERYFGGTAMTRAKRNGLRRNALIAMTVTGDPLLGTALGKASQDCGYPIAETLNQIENYLETSAD